MNDEKDSGSSFVVKDRRRFTEEGDPKAKASEQAEKPTESVDSEDSKETVSAEEDLPEGPTEAGQDADEGPEINFSSFVVSLATQALVQLGEATPPQGFEIPVDPAAARQSIEIIKMLEEKTRGNLDENESRLIENILHELHLSFVRASGG